MSDFIPNSFQVPNILIDRIQPHLKPIQLSCLIYIIRKTRGWQKLQESISVSEFMSACFTSDRRTIFKALDVLERAGLVTATKRLGAVNRYALNRIFSEPVSKNDTGQVVTKIVTRLVTLNDTGSGKTSVKKCHSIENNKSKRKALARGNQIGKQTEPNDHDREAIIERGRDLGLQRQRGESLAHFRMRVLTELSRGRFDAMQG